MAMSTSAPTAVLIRIDAAGVVVACHGAAPTVAIPLPNIGESMSIFVDGPYRAAFINALNQRETTELTIAHEGHPYTISLFPQPDECLAFLRSCQVEQLFDEFTPGLTHALESPDSKTYLDRLAHVVGTALQADRAVVAHVFGHPSRRLRISGQWLKENDEHDVPLAPSELAAAEVLAQDSEMIWLEGFRPESCYGVSFLDPTHFRGYIRVLLRDAIDRSIGLLEIGCAAPLPKSEVSRQVVELVAACASIELSRQRDTTEADTLVNDLRQRMQELSCFYGLTESLRTRTSLSEVCEDLAHLIPSVWQYPDIARARVVIDGEVHISQPFKDSSWGMSAAIMAGGRARGSLQVFYIENRNTGSGSEPFLPAERKLLDALARTLGEAIEKREAEAEIHKQSIVLTQERNRLETILRSIGDGVVVTDNTDRILLINSAAMELLNLPDGKGVGTNILKQIPDAAFRKAWNESGESQTEPFKLDFHVTGPVTRTITATRTRVPDLVRGLPGCVTILHDVTKERQIDQMKTDFVSSITHELRTPMTSIKGFAATLLRSPDIEADRRKRFLSIIGQEADRLLGMIEELLLISRIESGAMEMEPAAVHFDALVHRVVAALEPLIAKKDLIMEVDVHPQLPQVLGDEDKLRVIVFNLLGNAVKFTPENGRIWVKVRPDDGHIVFEVTDTGIGIPEAEQDRVFERFYRVHRPGSAHPGTGLGLFITREIVNLHGGEITLASRVNEGTSFRVRLPLRGPSQSTPPETTKETGAPA